jgi:hypothetical protein
MNNTDIVQHIFMNKSLISELFEKLRSTDEKVKFDAVSFMLEICQISKGMQLQSRFQFFESLPKHNFFEIISECLEITKKPASIKPVEKDEVKSSLTDGAPPKEEGDKENIDILQRPKGSVYDIDMTDLLKINSVELLMNCIQIVPSTVIGLPTNIVQLKAFLLSDEEKARDYKMLNLIFDELLNNQEIGIKMQVNLLIKLADV